MMTSHGTLPNVDNLRWPHSLSSLDQAIETVARAHGLPHLASETDLGPIEWGNIETSPRSGRPVIPNVFNAPSGVAFHSVIAYDLVGGNLLILDTDYPGQIYTWNERTAKLNTVTATFLEPGQH